MGLIALTINIWNKNIILNSNLRQKQKSWKWMTVTWKTHIRQFFIPQFSSIIFSPKMVGWYKKYVTDSTVVECCEHPIFSCVLFSTVPEAIVVLILLEFFRFMEYLK